MLNIRPLLELLFWAGLGAASAIAIDYNISLDGSLLHSFTGMIDIFAARYTPYWSSLWIAAATLLIIGACSTFYFRPLSRKGAFAGGFGTIGALALLMP